MRNTPFYSLFTKKIFPINSCSFYIHQNCRRKLLSMENLSVNSIQWSSSKNTQINFILAPPICFLNECPQCNKLIATQSNRHKQLCVTFVTVTQMSRLNKLLKHAQMASCNGSNFRLIRGSIISCMNCLFDGDLYVESYIHVISFDHP